MDRRVARLSAVALVERAIADETSFKEVVTALERRAPDEEAAGRVVAGYRAGAVAPWLAAVLLGRLRVKGTHAVVREILVAAPGLCAEDYAGAAIARIGAPGARDDLVALLLEPHHRRCREGARAGLVALGDVSVVALLLEHLRAGRISRKCAAVVVAGLPVGEDEIGGWLGSVDRFERMLALGVVLERCDAAATNRAGRSLAEAARAVLAAEPELLPGPIAELLGQRLARVLA